MSFEADWQMISERSGDAIFFEKVMKAAKVEAKRDGITLESAQELGLASHISAMIRRGREGEALTIEDKTLFDEVSEGSLHLAARICGMVSGIHEDEKYLLSTHFEIAKLN
ncbi:hypothetical protein [Paenilisteria rocourtiae]|uniref:PRD domain protein (TIGR03582 family) n=1 Tax=Listeria rocourtiae TaxID=647910 RepID=A0A4R6ZSL3_9LIST|nr:hypothetical protein [Listeria rocourtiae]EUJ43149.1 hypothetical protein PROCOU_15959 [Listeria rocourtiae FSL F6-920]MBC1603124.1 hypothetical protein [Listeria rocourtiae]TDR55595.1 PRD domain protein (TIGR03582 family) [Listeria rocourtiae]